MKGAQEEKKGKTNESFLILTLERKRSKEKKVRSQEQTREEEEEEVEGGDERRLEGRQFRFVWWKSLSSNAHPHSIYNSWVLEYWILRNVKVDVCF